MLPFTAQLFPKAGADDTPSRDCTVAMSASICFLMLVVFAFHVRQPYLKMAVFFFSFLFFFLL